MGTTLPPYPMPDGNGGTTMPGSGNSDILSQIWQTLGGGGSNNDANALLRLLGIGGQVGAAALQQGNLNNAFNYINKIGQQASGQNTGNLGNATNVYGQQAGGLGGFLDGSNPYAQLLSQGYMGNVQTLNNLLPGLIQPGQNLAEFGNLPNNLLYQDPNMVAQTRGITDLTSATGGMLNKASQLLNSGGITDTQSPLNNFAMQLMAGQNPNQQALAGAGTSLLGTQGLTPALQAALQQASGVVGSQGRTSLTDALAGKGMGLAGTSPLLSGAQAASIAEDQTGRQYANAAKNAREQAGLRGQGAGASVANGAGNAALADTSDQALNGIATARNNALLNQQGLGLQQQQQGLNTALGSAGLQQGLELGGLGAVGNLTGAQGGLLNTGGNLTNSAAGLANQGGNFYNALLGLQQGNMAQGFNAGQAGVTQQSGLLQQAMNDIMQGRTGAAGIGNQLASQYGSNQNALLQGISQGANTQLGALSQLGSQGGNWLQAAMQALGTYGGTGASAANLLKQAPYASILNNIGGALGSAGSNAGKNLATGAGTAVGTGIGTVINGRGGNTNQYPDPGDLFNMYYNQANGNQPSIGGGTWTFPGGSGGGFGGFDGFLSM